MSDSPAVRWLKKHPALLALLALTILAVVVTWPLAARLGTSIPGNGGDAFVHVWTFEWVKQALASGQSPFYTELLFFPDGASLLFHNFAWVHIAVWLPLQALVGAYPAYGLIFLIIFIFNGFSAYLLARDLTASHFAGFTAGLVLGFWPYILSQHNHPNLVTIGWVALVLLYLRRMFLTGRIRDALLAGLFLALLGLTRWQLLAISIYLIGLFVVYLFFTVKKVGVPRLLALLALTGLLAIVLMAPVAAPVITGQLTRENPEDLFVEEELDQTDLLAYVVPNRYQPLWGNAVTRFYENFDVNKDFVPFIGYSVLVLVILAVTKRWRDGRFWLLAALVYIVLALGPQLRFNGALYIDLPYKLIEEQFFVKIVRRPDRFNVILGIPVAILASWGMVVNRDSLSRKRVYYLFGMLFFFLILAEYMVSYPTFRLQTPAWYEQLADDPETYGIAGVPMHERSFANKKYMVYQLTHGKPLVDGHVSRPLNEAFRFIDSVPLLSSMRLDPESPPEVAKVSQQLRMLAAQNVRYFILHKGLLTGQKVSDWRNWLVVEPQYEDGEVVVYGTDPLYGKDFTFSDELLMDNEGGVAIGLIRANVLPESNTVTINVATSWGSQTGVAKNYDYCLTLVETGGRTVDAQCAALTADWPTSRWQANEVVNARLSYEPDQDLPPGEYEIRLLLRESAAEQDTGESVSLGQVIFGEELQPEASWRDTFSLESYTVSQLMGDTSSLDVNLNWRSLSETDESYKIFLHLLNEDSGEVMTQTDIVSRDWTYPTYQWQAGESIEDFVSLPVTGVPPGAYRLTVGFYVPESGQRLDVVDSSGTPFENMSFPLLTLQR
jgi:hypothetical protein